MLSYFNLDNNDVKRNKFIQKISNGINKISFFKKNHLFFINISIKIIKYY
jgi:hypothetical protein